MLHDMFQGFLTRVPFAKTVSEAFRRKEVGWFVFVFFFSLLDFAVDAVVLLSVVPLPLADGPGELAPLALGENRDGGSEVAAFFIRGVERPVAAFLCNT